MQTVQWMAKWLAFRFLRTMSLVVPIFPTVDSWDFFYPNSSHKLRFPIPMLLLCFFDRVWSVLLVCRAEVRINRTWHLQLQSILFGLKRQSYDWWFKVKIYPFNIPIFFLVFYLFRFGIIECNFLEILLMLQFKSIYRHTDFWLLYNFGFHHPIEVGKSVNIFCWFLCRLRETKNLHLWFWFCCHW